MVLCYALDPEERVKEFGHAVFEELTPIPREQTIFYSNGTEWN